MASAIDLASNALLLIGDNPISSFDDAGAGAQTAGALYPDTKRRVLSEHPWSFALKQQRLNKLSQKPDTLTNYTNAFPIPPDLIRLWNLQPWSDYMIVGDLIYTNQTELLATYVYDVDEVQFPPHMIKAMEYTLAADFSISIMENEKLATLFTEKALLFTSKAMATDSQNRPQSAIMDSPLVSVRFGSDQPTGYGY